MTADIILTNGTYTVTIFTVKVEDSLTKKLVVISPPTPTASWSAGPKDSKIVDLLRVEKRFNIDGHVSATDGAFGSGDSQSTASGKRDDLKNLFNAGGTCTMTYDSGSYVVNIEKLSISDIPNDETTASKYDVKLTLIVGVNI